MRSLLIIIILIAGLAQAQETINLKTAPPAFAKLQLTGVSRNMSTINSRFFGIDSATVTFTDKSLNLTLIKRMPPCQNGMICAMAMPAPIFINLQVIKIKHTECGTTYTAVTPKNALSKIYEIVTLEDFTYSKCMQTMNLRYMPGVLNYKVSGISTLTKRSETAEANFEINEEIIRALN